MEAPWYEVGSYNELTPEQRKALEEHYQRPEYQPDPPRGMIPTLCPQCRATVNVGDLFGVLHGSVVICKDCYQLEMDKEEDDY